MRRAKKALMVLGTLALLVNFPVGKSATVDAANAWSGSHFGMDFDYDESSRFEKSSWANGDMFDCTWKPGNVKFNNGQMALTIDRDWSGYTAGEYRTKDYFGYGLYQVSMKPISNPGVVSSFFTYTGPSDGTKWDEIDIEFLGYDTTKVQFNYYTNGVANHEYLYNLGFDASKSFHTYGFNWYQGGITWYVDGKAVYTATRDIPNTPGKIMMNAWPGKGVDDWLKPFNGRTGLTAYYDWASYDAPDGKTTTVVSNNTNNNNNNNNYSNNNNNYSSSSNQSSGALFDSTKTYKIINKNSGLAVDVNRNGRNNGENILQYRYKGSDNQRWTIERQSNGYYIIKNRSTGKVLTVQDNATWDGANICQWDYYGNASQEWSFVASRNNTYKIINKASGKCLNIAWGSKDNSANIEQYKDVDSDGQLFWIDAAN
ncbi:MAG: RICIN domain-containing protein [Lachnospiraceae bacterium]|nr:RICIN domain-containing protein [Lachnospiraceae bacterium]